MFEGLDQIDWKSLGRHISRDGNISESIRSLASEDPDARREAREFLLGPGSNSEYASDTTPYIIPFVLQVLGNLNMPDKAALLAKLSSVAEDISHSQPLSIHQMRRYVETYDALRAGLPIFIALLDANSISVRTTAINLLKYFSSDFETLLSEFFRHFPIEEENIQVVLLTGAKRLLNPITWAHYDYEFHQTLKEKYKPVLKEIIETHSSHKVQVAAARALIEIFSRSEGNKERASSKVSILLSEEFLSKSGSLNILDPHSTWDEDFAEAIMLMKDLIRLNAETLFNLLQAPIINALQAHIIFNGLITSTMGLDYLEPFWNNDLHLDYRKRDSGLFYVNDYSLAINLRSIANHELNHPESNFDRPTLPAIFALIENDVFWKTPTNLLSFFYGLPDSREEFREVFKLNSES